jgi:hypothetical protein
MATRSASSQAASPGWPPGPAQAAPNPIGSDREAVLDKAYKWIEALLQPDRRSS